MAKKIFSELPALERVANLATRNGMSAEPYVTLRKMGKHRYPFPQKKKVVIDGVLCAVSVQCASWTIQPKRPDGVRLTQVHAHKCRPSKSRPKVLIFDIRVDKKVRGQIYSITREEFFLNYPSGHANIPTGRHVHGGRAAVLWTLHRGGTALKKCIRSAKAAEDY